MSKIWKKKHCSQCGKRLSKYHLEGIVNYNEKLYFCGSTCYDKYKENTDE